MKNKESSVLKYLEESKKAIAIVTIAFIISAFIGYANADSLAEKINPIIKDLIEKASDLQGIDLMSFIFLNNSLTSFLGIILGMFLGIFPIITLVSNGIIIGYVMKITADSSSFLDWWKFLPHGIFELPAIFISLGLGLRLGEDIISFYTKKNKKSIVKIILGPISLVLGLLSIGILKLTFDILLRNSSISSTLTSSESLYLGIFTLLLSALFIAPFIILFFFNDKKIKDYTLNRIFISIKVFFAIVIPLLIIAAIIEGLLITIL